MGCRVNPTEQDRARESGMKAGMEAGLEKGIEKKLRGMEGLIIKLGLSDEQIADIAQLPSGFVKEVRANLYKK